MPQALNIKLRCASWHQLANIYRRDLARQAIFLKSNSPPPLGTEIRLDLALPTGSMVVLTGTIAEHIPSGGLGGRGPGIDIKLNTIPQSALWLIETALDSSHKAADAPDGAAVPTADAAAEDSRELVAAESELLAALTAELTSLRKLNPFQVLGVHYDATDEAVRAAFGDLTKRYHPDRFARYTSASLRTLAAEIFILIRDAYGRLGDQTSRAKVLAELGGRGKVRIPPTAAGDDSADRPATARPSAPSASPPAAPRTSRAEAKPRPAATPAPVAADPPASPPSDSLDDARDDLRRADQLLDAGRYDEAQVAYVRFTRRHPSDRNARAGIELSEGLRALAQRDRLEAAQRFETALEIDPTNERAARELAEMRRLATNERKGLLSRLMGKKE